MAFARLLSRGLLRPWSTPASLLHQFNATLAAEIDQCRGLESGLKVALQFAMQTIGAKEDLLKTKDRLFTQLNTRLAVAEGHAHPRFVMEQAEYRMLEDVKRVDWNFNANNRTLLYKRFLSDTVEGKAFFQEAWSLLKGGKPENTPLNPTEVQVQSMVSDFTSLYAKLSEGGHLPDINPYTGLALDPKKLGPEFVGLMKLLCNKANILWYEVLPDN
eukprot:m.164518 g.164518  ORF g.164518 m.164518 type:complete len:216 (+) comp9884_c0_seq3:55-702(+)